MSRAAGGRQLRKARLVVLAELQRWLAGPMVVLAFAWLALFVTEIVWGLTPFLRALGWLVWGLFLLDFLVGFALAPSKGRFLRRNWLSALALAAPALRLLALARFFRVARATRLVAAGRSLRLLRFASSINRGMKALGASMGRRGAGYVTLLTLIITLAGAAGMYGFENSGPAGHRLDSFGEALWWTAMIMTTMGSDYWPHTGAGRVLCVLLSLYSLAVLGYIAGVLSTYFIGRDARSAQGEVAGSRDLERLRQEINLLREDIRGLRQSPPPDSRARRDQTGG